MRDPRSFVLWLALGALAPTLAAAAIEQTSPRLQLVIASQRQLAQEHPGDAGVHNDLGNLLMLAGEPEAAREAYDRALTIEPKMASARYNLALLVHESGRRRTAARHLRKLLHNHPDHALARYELGAIASERGRTERAVRHFAKAFELRPELADPMVNPHAVKNRFVARASLMAYTRRSAAAYIERSYEDSARIAAALIGVVEPTSEPAPMGLEGESTAPTEPESEAMPQAEAMPDDAAETDAERTGGEPEPPPGDGWRR